MALLAVSARYPHPSRMVSTRGRLETDTEKDTSRRAELPFRINCRIGSNIAARLSGRTREPDMREQNQAKRVPGISIPARPSMIGTGIGGLRPLIEYGAALGI